MSKGIFLPGGQFLSFAESAGPPQTATRRTALGGLLAQGWLPNPDPVLRAMGADIDAYRDLRSDAAVAGALRRRRAAVAAMEHGLERGRAAARFTGLVADALEALPLTQLISEILQAAELGYAVLEVSWAAQGGAILPVAVTGKPQQWFRFHAEDNRLLFLSRQRPQGEEVPERKFLVVTQESSYDNPYGLADLSLCFWPVTFRRGGLKFWSRFVEKYGAPFLLGKLPRGRPESEYSALAESLAAMVQDAVAVVPDDGSISALSVAGDGHAQNFEQYLLYCRSEIAFALLGQNQGSEQNSTNASANAGLAVTRDIRDGLAELVSGAMATLIRWTAELNGYAGPLPKWSLWEQEEIDDLRASRDEKLSRAGCRFTPQYWERSYSLAAGDLEQAPAPPAPAGVQLAEPAPPRPGTPAADVPPIRERLGAQAEPLIQGMLAPVRQALAEAQSLEAFGQRLLELYPQMDSSAYGALMGQAITLAELTGREALRGR